MAFRDWWSRSRSSTTTKAASGVAVDARVLSHSQIRDALFASLSPVGKAPTTDGERISAAEHHPVVMSVVRKIAWSASSVKWLVESDDGSVTDAHPLAARLNGKGIKWGTWQLVHSSLAITGRAYLLRINSPVNGRAPAGLAFLPPQSIQRIVDLSTGTTTGYRYASGSTVKTFSREEVIEVIHPWLSSPDDGFSAMTPAWGPLSLFQAMSTLMRRILENNGGLPGILVFSDRKDIPRSRDQKDDLAEYISSFRAGGDQFGRIGMLDTAGGDAKFLKITTDMGDLEPAATKGEAMREICNVFGVPPILMSMGERTTFENQKEARRYFWLETIVPGHLEPLQSALTEAFGRTVKPDLSEVPALADYRTSLIESLVKAPLTVDEIREALGYPPVGGSIGPTLLIPGSQFPMGVVGQAGGEASVEVLNELVARITAEGAGNAA